jgi:hypothetical protein
MKKVAFIVSANYLSSVAIFGEATSGVTGVVTDQNGAVVSKVSRRIMKKFSIAFLLIVFGSVFTFAQGTRGTIRGTVKDPNGAVIANATVRLVDSAKGSETRTVQSDENGDYQMLEIEPSTYNLMVSAPNFAEYRAANVKVEPNRNLVLDAALSVGTVANEVTVTAAVELIDKESATLGTTVDRRRVEGLPLNGREVIQLALLQPGVAPAAGAFGNGSGFRSNGSRGVENNITLDGANNNEVAVGGSIGGQPRPDAIQEFRLLTSNFEPEFGRNTGAVVNVVTKSGTNDFHGNARFFYRPTKLSAARFLDKAVSDGDPERDLRRKFERKEYGFNIGGPIYFLNFGEGVPAIYDGKDRSFFFVDYERRWMDVGASRTISNLPTAAERAGDFSQLGRTIVDPATGLPFPGNVIPANRISPIAQFFLPFLPAANAQGQAQVSANVLDINNYLTLRLDHNVSDNHLLNFSFNYFDTDSANPFQTIAPTASVPGFGVANLRETKNFVGRYTWVASSNIANSFLVSYSRNFQPAAAPVNTTSPAQIGFTADFVADGTFAGPPFISLADRGLSLGNSIQGPQQRVTQNIQFQDSVSWVIGSHRLKFGADFTKYKQATDFLFVNQGIFTFAADGLEGVTNTTGDDFADFLIGNTPAAIQFGAAGHRDPRQRAWAGFVQDSWRATNNLTLSYGVRYEYTSPLTDLRDLVAYYRPGAISTLLTSGQLVNQDGQTVVIPPGGRAPRGLVYVGDPDPVLGGTVPRGGVEVDKNNFAPRVGFAYAFTKAPGFLSRIVGENQTVIRGGFGLFYGAVIGDTALQQLSAPAFNGTNFFQFPASGTLADPFAPDPFPTFGGDQGQIVNPFGLSEFVLSAPLAQFSQPIDPNLKTPQVTQFNLTLERGFAKDYVVSLSYVGNRGRKLYVRENINPSLGTFLPSSLRSEPTPAPTTANANLRRLNDDVRIALNQLTTGGNSQFDSFQGMVQKRYGSDGLLFQLSYTFSKSLTDSDSQRGQLDLLDRRFGWGRSVDDHPHRFVASAIYEIPFFRGTSGFLKRLVDGWSIGGIYTYQSGDLITVGNPVDTTGTGGAILSFADLGDPFEALDGVDNDRQGFNASAFRSFSCGTGFTNTAVCGPTGFRRGTSGINQFRLDNPTNNFDVILAKRLKLFSESNNLELRFEAFNVLNTTQFTTINLNLTSSGVSGFGKYTDQRESRVIQLAARLNF